MVAAHATKFLSALSVKNIVDEGDRTEVPLLVEK